MADYGGLSLGIGGLLTGAGGFVTALRARGKVAQATTTKEEHAEQLEAWQGIATAFNEQLKMAVTAHENCERRVNGLSTDVSRLRTELLALRRGWDRLPGAVME